MRPVDRRPWRFARAIEWGCWTLGASLLALHSTTALWAQYGRQVAVEEFEGSREQTLVVPRPDRSLWAPTRTDEYERALRIPGIRAEAVIRIKSISLEVPVFAGATELHMTLGAGRVVGSPGFGEPGNVGVSSHRDGHFRKLKDIRVGDRIVVETRSASYTYVVQEIRITDPSDTSVLWPGSRPELTLLTCYPFYYRGQAPQRFVVRAEMLPEEWP